MSRRGRGYWQGRKSRHIGECRRDIRDLDGCITGGSRTVAGVAVGGRGCCRSRRAGRAGREGSEGIVDWSGLISRAGNRNGDGGGWGRDVC